tara:strand:- start:948 stop:1697 length:750 start_codon:yes stop_codon:yes gene_type:complete
MHRDEILKKNADKKDAKAVYNKSYYAKNKEQLDAKSGDRAESCKVDKLECECGAYIRRDYYKNHLKSSTHIKSFEEKIETTCECGQPIWYSDSKWKMTKHYHNPKHQAWLNADTYIPYEDCVECEECLEDEVIIVLPDLVLTDEEICNVNSEDIKKLLAQKDKRNAYANHYYNKNKDKIIEQSREYYAANKQNVREVKRAYAKSDRAKQMRRDRYHKTITCDCGWVGLNGSKSRHQSQVMHLNWLQNKQ